MFLEFYIGYCFLDAVFFLRKENSYFTLLRLFMFIVFAITVYLSMPDFEKGITDEERWCIDKPSYKEDWVDLTHRPSPSWYHAASIGIHVYWSVLSVPDEKEAFWKSFLDGEWNALNEVSQRYGERFTYAMLATQFRAELFDPDQWMTMFGNAGARYVIVSAKSIDGFALFPSKHSFSWNSVEKGPKRDLLHVLETAAQKHGLKFGASYPLYQWPLAHEFEFGHTENDSIDITIWSDIKQLVHDYQISVLRFVGDNEAHDFYQNTPQIPAWIYNKSPDKYDKVITDAWDTLPPCHEHLLHVGTHINVYKREDEILLDKRSQFYRRTLLYDDVIEIKEVITTIIGSIISGHNVVIGVSPAPDGTIPVLIQERLWQLGEWLKINGRAIYGAYPWATETDPISSHVRYTCNRPLYLPGTRTIYALFTEWPEKNRLVLGRIGYLFDFGEYRISLLGQSDTRPLKKWRIGSAVEINLPKKAKVRSKDVWVLQIEPVGTPVYERDKYIQ